MGKEKQHIDKCLRQIEEKIGWGSGAEWQNQDFEELSKRIFLETKVSLSVSTLKRLWGKIRYEGTPNVATLNTLAQFIGYENWRAFTANGFPPISNRRAGENSPVLMQRGRLLQSRIFKSILALVAVGIVVILFWQIQTRPKRLEYDRIVFNSQPVTNTVPNTVIFNYNAKDSNADSVFIQQSWDPNRRFKVDKNLTTYSSTYYLPGYYRAKLILDTLIVAEHDIFIESNGWLATIDRQPIPVYANEEKILQDGIVRVSNEFLTAQKIDLEKEQLWTSFYRVAKNEVVPDDAFELEATLKNAYGKGPLVCQQTYIVLMGTMGAIAIPLSIKGCVGELNLQTDDSFNGKTNDLSKFGVDFSDWVRVKCRSKDKKMSIWVNDVLAFEDDYQKSIGGIMGTRIAFMGTGEIKDFKLRALGER
jgi:hypothetical protein